jgi:hypothetical protein
MRSTGGSVEAGRGEGGAGHECDREPPSDARIEAPLTESMRLRNHATASYTDGCPVGRIRCPARHPPLISPRSRWLMPSTFSKPLAGRITARGNSSFLRRSGVATLDSPSIGCEGDRTSFFDGRSSCTAGRVVFDHATDKVLPPWQGMSRGLDPQQRRQPGGRRGYGEQPERSGEGETAWQAAKERCVQPGGSAGIRTAANNQWSGRPNA